MKKEGKTQTEKVYDYINEHGSITQYEAFTELGIMRLASRISDLKKADFKIDTKYKTVTGRDGTKTKIAVYSWKVKAKENQEKNDY